METVSWQYARRRKYNLCEVKNPHKYRYKLEGGVYVPIKPDYLGKVVMWAKSMTGLVVAVTNKNIVIVPPGSSGYDPRIEETTIEESTLPKEALAKLVTRLLGGESDIPLQWGTEVKYDLEWYKKIFYDQPGLRVVSEEDLKKYL